MTNPFSTDPASPEQMALPARTVGLTSVRGGSNARDHLFSVWLPVVLRWCVRLGGPSVDAEDAAHDVFIVVLRRVDQVANEAQLSAWLFSVTRRVLAQHRRRAWVRRWVPGLVLDTPDPGRGPAALMAVDQTSRAVQSVLDRLPEAERAVLVLGLLEDRSDREVADMLGVPHGTVKSRVRRARSRFLELAHQSGLSWETLSVENPS